MLLLLRGSSAEPQPRSLLVHPDHPAVEPVALRLAGICIFLLLCPSWLFYKGAVSTSPWMLEGTVFDQVNQWAYLGLEFFGLWRFRELHPEWRRALMPWWCGFPLTDRRAPF